MRAAIIGMLSLAVAACSSNDLGGGADAHADVTISNDTTSEAKGGDTCPNLGICRTFDGQFVPELCNAGIAYCPNATTLVGTDAGVDGP